MVIIDGAGVWRWSVCNERKPRLLSLEVLSNVSVFSSVRLFLVRFEAVSKLLALLASANDMRSVSAGGNYGGVDISSTQFILKSIVNLCTTNEMAKRIVCDKLMKLKLGTDNVKFIDLAKNDEILTFYLRMLN